MWRNRKRSALVPQPSARIFMDWRIWRVFSDPVTCQLFGIESTDAGIPHEPTLEWLQKTAPSIMLRTPAPAQLTDVAYALHDGLLCFLYVDLREAIRLASSPGPLRRGPGTHCLCMRQSFHKNDRKIFRTRILATYIIVKRSNMSKEYGMTSWSLQ